MEEQRVPGSCKGRQGRARTPGVGGRLSPDRLLYVSYHYPLGGSSGSHRTLRMSRHLTRLGWQVTVLCGPPPPDLPPAPDLPFALLSVPSLLDRHFARPAASGPAHTPSASNPDRPSRVRRVLRELAFVPDPQLYWIPPAVAAARRALAGGRADAVFCSGPPFSAFFVGRTLKALGWSPLALDYRDVWLGHPWWPVPRWRRGIESLMERHVLAAADLVIVNHEPMLNALLERHPFAKERCLAIPNGFDAEELGPPVEPSWQPGQTFEVVYAGTLYGPVARGGLAGGILSVQRPVGFFEALRRLSHRGIFGTGGVRVTFVGAKPGTEEAANLQACAREKGVESLVQVLPRGDKASVVPLLRRAHLLLNILYYTEAQVAQKIYDYLHLGIPILSLLRESEANASIVRRAGAGPIVDPADVEGIVSAIESVLEGYRATHRPVAGDRNYIEQFDARAQAGRIDTHLRRLMRRNRATVETSVAS
jgi:glycosyltransferase involved in cell wall biosynthesis